ncbi:MAG: helix-turn-helix transcriptional regulator [Emergencia sp.]|nr:helix-turn-helix transcriptional regulator [Emergencia sp.]
MQKKEFQISLAAARVNAGLTQDDVAKEMHVGKQTIVNWEKGNSEPKLEQARALSALYNMPSDYILLSWKSN